jgi:hypothetical protein
MKTITKNILEKFFKVRVERLTYGTLQTRKLLINEAVHLEKGVIFIAIPKTGTTSVRTQLSQLGKPIIHNPHLDIIQVRDLIHTYILIKRLGTNTSFPSVNLADNEEIKKDSELIFNSLFKFSAVRNPWSRAVSLYFRREGVKIKDLMTFDEFCTQHFYASDTCYYPTLHKNQYDWLSDENGVNLMDYVYKVEQFSSAVKEIQNLTEGKLVLTDSQENRNPDSRSKDYRKLFNDKTRKIIEKRFEKDIDYFKYTF